jgi:DNA polymerase-1
MSAVIVPLHPSPDDELRGLRQTVREANALGVKFRISGADVVIDIPEPFPASLRVRLREYQQSGWLYAFFGGEELERATLDFARGLGVESVPVETRAEARWAIANLIFDAKENNGTIGLDIETTPKPGNGAPRPPIRLTQDGVVAEVQPKHLNRFGRPDRTGLDAHLSDIACLQLHAGGTQCFVFRGEALSLVARSHWLRRQHLVIHNAEFETRFLAALNYRLPSGRRRHPNCQVECTMQAAGLLFGVERSAKGGRSLANTAKQLFDLDVPKDLQVSDWGAARLSPGQIAYAGTDAIQTWRAWPKLRAQLHYNRHPEYPSRWNAYELQRDVVPSVAAMRQRGLLIDRKPHRRQIDGWARELARDRQQYTEMTGSAPPATPDDIRKFLTDVLEPQQLELWPRTQKSGQLSTSRASLKWLAEIPSVGVLLRILANEKLLQNFGPRLVEYINPGTGRIHCDYLIGGTKAGRFAAAHPNLQQLPSKRSLAFRQCVIAAPGHVLVVADYNQVELRAAAHITGETNLTRIYAQGGDLHRATAASFLGIAPEAVSDEQRASAKPVNFGAIYGIGAKKLRQNAFVDWGIVMSLAEAQERLDRFFDAFPTLARWRSQHAADCQRRGYIIVPGGRIVEASWEHPWPGKARGELSFNQCCNIPIQGACADCLMQAMTLLHARLQWARVRGGLVACVHDELLLEVHEDDAETARRILEQTMTDAFAATFPGAPMNGVATAKIGRTWAEAKG